MSINVNELYLREQDRLRLLDIVRRYLPNTTVWVYGSRINGKAHAASDLDIVVRSCTLAPIAMLQWYAFVNALRDSYIPIIVDAHDWACLPNAFHAQIEQNHVVLYSNE